jgi:hypothetical protein
MGMQKKNEKKDFSEIVRKWKKWWGVLGISKEIG